MNSLLVFKNSSKSLSPLNLRPINHHFSCKFSSNVPSSEQQIESQDQHAFLDPMPFSHPPAAPRALKERISLFPSIRKPTIHFPPSQSQSKKLRPSIPIVPNHSIAPSDIQEITIQDRVRDVAPYFIIGPTASPYTVLRNTFLRGGFKRTDEEGMLPNAIWGRHPKADQYKSLHPLQRVNHFPYSWELGRKDRLARNLRRSVQIFGEKEFGFAPQTFVLPEDTALLKQHMLTHAQNDRTYILKPPASSCGRGIRLIKSFEEIDFSTPCIVQDYIPDPLLIDGYKFDLRLYVAITSVDPLRVYLYSDGLARFATQKYEGESTDISNRFMHLTNYSVNKYATNFVRNKDPENDDEGNKWSVKALRRRLAKDGVDDSLLFDRISNVISKTVVSAADTMAFRTRQLVKYRSTCFELLGFDILVDKHLQPWLIEVNLMPSLGCASPLDTKIKSGALTDLFNLAGFHRFDRQNNDSGSGKIVADSTIAAEYNVFENPLNGPNFDQLQERVDAANVSSAQGLLDSSLSLSELSTLVDFEDEYARRGQFELICPVVNDSENNGNPVKYMRSPSPFNDLLSKWIKQDPQHRLKQLQLAVETMKR